MNDFLLQGVLTVSMVVGCIVFSYAKFKRGLFTRMMLLLAPLVGASSYGCWVVGHFPHVLSLWLLVNLGTLVLGVVTIGTLYLGVVSRLQALVTSLTANTAQIASTAKQAAAIAAEQASTVAQVTTTVSEINQISAVASETSQQVLRTATDATDRGQSGLKALSEAIKVMDRIKQVEEIVDMVNDLSEQSNLLAVNASIEAAKAGDQGRGFAVVATEVRSLAEQSKDATRQIREAIRRTEDGKKSVESVHVLVQDLARVLVESADRARQISGAAVQQAAGMRQISEAMSNVSQGGQDNAAAAQQLEHAARALMSVSQEIQVLVTG